MVSKRGQVTIFIIIALLIVAAIIAVLLFFGRVKVEAPDKVETEGFIEKCVRDSVEPSIKKVLAGGGRIEPELFIMYQGEIYNYLCYQKNFYLPCINTHPRLKAIVEAEIKKDIISEVEQCFVDLKEDLEAKGFSISESVLTNENWDVELIPGGVKIDIEKRLDVVKGESSQTFEKFDVVVISPLYELVGIVRQIVNQEAEYCNFEYNGFMLLYPQYKIKRIDYDGSKIYKVIDRRSGKEFKFAVRSCAFPPGI